MLHICLACRAQMLPGQTMSWLALWSTGAAACGLAITVLLSAA